MAVRLPAEWEPQDAVWLAWPRDPLTWPDRLPAARAAYQQAIDALAAVVDVHVIVHPDVPPAERPRLRGRASAVEVIHQDSWVRDYGPLTLIDPAAPQGRRHVKFRFDAWGGKYESLMADDAVVGRLQAAGALELPVEEVDFVLEGGAVETDGQGTFLATQSVCRGRGQDPADFEEVLRTHLGARHVIWLGEGIEGDDTDGHIDTLARFIHPGVVVATRAPEGHPDHAALEDNWQRLRDATDASGRRLRLAELPPAPRIERADGEPLPAGYANFLLSNGRVLLPTFGAPQDTAAAALLGRLRQPDVVVPIPHQDLIWGYGGIHCLSMHQADR